METRPRRALVLGGGGARGSFQVGMLLELVVNRGLDFDIIRGVSVGALNAAFLAQASVGANAKESLENLKHQVGELHKLWQGIEGNHSIYKSRTGFPGLLLGADSIYSLEPLRQLLHRSVDPNKLKVSGRDFAVGTVSLVTGTYSEWNSTDADFLEKILASATIPVAFPHITIERPRKDMLVDGGVRNITPLRSAFKSKPDEIYVLLTSRMIREGKELPESSVLPHRAERWTDDFLGTKVNGLDVLKRTLEILTDEIYLEDLRGALKWNKVAKSAQAGVRAKSSARGVGKTLKTIKRRYVPIHVLAPREWFGEGIFPDDEINSATQFSPRAIRKAIDHGKAVAAEKGLWLWP